MKDRLKKILRKRVDCVAEDIDYDYGIERMAKEILSLFKEAVGEDRELDDDPQTWIGKMNYDRGTGYNARGEEIMRRLEK